MAKKIVEEEKLDHVFRVFLKTNSMKKTFFFRIELPNNEVQQQNYGNMPKFEPMIPYVGETFELYLDGKLVGMRILLKASKETITYDSIGEDEVEQARRLMNQ